MKESQMMRRATVTKALLLLTISLGGADASPRQLGTFVAFQHGIEGRLEGEADSLTIHDFSYDGRGPGGSTFFYIVNSSYVYSPEDFERGYSGSEGFKVSICAIWLDCSDTEYVKLSSNIYNFITVLLFWVF